MTKPDEQITELRAKVAELESRLARLESLDLLRAHLADAEARARAAAAAAEHARIEREHREAMRARARAAAEAFLAEGGGWVNVSIAPDPDPSCIATIVDVAEPFGALVGTARERHGFKVKPGTQIAVERAATFEGRTRFDAKLRDAVARREIVVEPLPYERSLELETNVQLAKGV